MADPRVEEQTLWTVGDEPRGSLATGAVRPCRLSSSRPCGPAGRRWTPPRRLRVERATLRVVDAPVKPATAVAMTSGYPEGSGERRMCGPRGADILFVISNRWRKAQQISNCRIFCLLCTLNFLHLHISNRESVGKFSIFPTTVFRIRCPVTRSSYSGTPTAGRAEKRRHTASGLFPHPRRCGGEACARGRPSRTRPAI